MYPIQLQLRLWAIVAACIEFLALHPEYSSRNAFWAMLQEPHVTYISCSLLLAVQHQYLWLWLLTHVIATYVLHMRCMCFFLPLVQASGSCTQPHWPPR